MTRSTVVGWLFLLTFLLGLSGIILFIGRENAGWFDAPFVLQRALILASWLMAAAGAVFLAGVRRGVEASALLLTGVVLVAVGALIASVVELSLLTRELSHQRLGSRLVVLAICRRGAHRCRAARERPGSHLGRLDGHRMERSLAGGLAAHLQR